jgi:uncharacterized membrane protein YoaK (UPF0700 family)
LLLLSAASGATDAIAYLLLGEVFTSAMTGNTALLGIALGLGRGAAAARSACALAGFVAGVSAATWLHTRTAPSLRPLFLLEMALAGAFALAWPVLAPLGAHAVYLLIFVSALAMGTQGLTALQASRHGVTTIVFTRVLVRIAEAGARSLLGSPAAREERRRAGRQAWGYVSYAGAAALAALFLPQDARWVVWGPLGAVAAAALCYELAGAKSATSESSSSGS